MFQILLGVAVALVVAGGSWLLDERLTRTGGTLRAMFSIVLVAATAGLIAVILAEPWLWDAEVPEEALWMFRMRVLAVFVMLGSLVLAISTVLVTIAALFMSHRGPKWRLCVVPTIALAAFALALHLVGTHHFMPAA